MCGHATIALARWAVDSGRVARREPETVVRLQCPCGLVVGKRRAPTARFGSRACRPSPMLSTGSRRPGAGDRFRSTSPMAAPSTPSLPAQSVGLDLQASPIRAIVDAGEEISKAAAAAIADRARREPELAFLYGTILTDGGDGAAASRAATSASLPADRSIAARPAAASPRAWPWQAARRQVAAGRAASVRELHRRGLHAARSLREAPPVGRASR